MATPLLSLPSEENATLDAIIAIGLQTIPHGSKTNENTERYFNRARKQAFEKLTDPTVEMVRMYVLLAFYALGDNSRHACCMYLGVAARAAMILDLHRTRLYMCSEETRDKLRAWIFGAGLVLGFSRFSGDRRQDIEDAFAQALDVLQGIGESSEQAKSHASTLSDLLEAVTRHREMIARGERGAIQQYAEKVLVCSRERSPSVDRHRLPQEFNGEDLEWSSVIEDFQIGDDFWLNFDAFEKPFYGVD